MTSALRRTYPSEIEWTTFHSSHRTVWPSTNNDCQPNTLAQTDNTLAWIPKPRGEVGCISKGGYSLRKVLGWDEPFYHEVQACPSSSLTFTSVNDKLKTYIHEQVAIYLPEQKPISLQKDITRVYEAVSVYHPFLLNTNDTCR